jgi:DNA-directed RNA polymerase subunit H (RpoH/RPB5)
MTTATAEFVVSMESIVPDHIVLLPHERADLLAAIAINLSQDPAVIACEIDPSGRTWTDRSGEALYDLLPWRLVEACHLWIEIDAGADPDKVLARAISG